MDISVVSIMPVTLVLFLMMIGASAAVEVSASVSETLNGCNPYEGEWVYDQSYPLFDSSKCTLIRREWACLRYGRPDQEYLKYRWQPEQCNLPRFDGVDFLKKLKGKRVLFIGDSISTNQWQSLVCLLMAAAPDNVTTSSNNSIPTYTFQNYGVSISIFNSNHLVDIVNEDIGRVLKLDSINNGQTWKQYDVLIFNTWLWWLRRGSGQQWDFIENDGQIVQDMDRVDAFRKALTTWSKWVNSDVYPPTKVFFQGISPSHYNGEEWNEPGANCVNQTRPMEGSRYPAGEPLASKVLKEVLETQISAPERVHLLDITTLSQLRKDGHPGPYNGFNRTDCTHWCVAGVLETWNQLLYAQLVHGS